MKDHLYAKHWKSVESQLTLAANYLLEPSDFSLQERDLSEYLHYIDNNEFELAMDELVGLAIERGCKPGFWRHIQKPAQQMGLDEKSAEYEELFHKALNEQ